MKRGDVVLVRFPHPSGQRGKKRPAVVVQSDAYASTVRTVVVAEVTKNLAMKDDPACLFIDVSTPEGKATGLLVDSVVSSLVLDTSIPTPLRRCWEACHHRSYRSSMIA
jgi:mRNA interferase MazF